MYKLTEPQKETGLLAAVLAILGIAILVFQLQQANQPEPPNKPREKNKLNPTFYSVEYFNEYLPKPEIHDTNKINNYIVEDTEESKVMKVEEKKEIATKITAIVTAYTNGVESTGKTPDHPSYGITASGRKTERYVTVACPPSIPLGTWIEIEGIGKRRCDDRGGAIVNNRFDIYMKHLDKALEFGKQELQVIILGG
jgi:3D (Asp-Asp-Asp) domain-containing protein